VRINLEEADDDEENDLEVEENDLEEKDLVEYEVLDTYSSSRCFLEELAEMWFGRVGGEVRGGSGRRSRRPSEFTLLGLRKQRPMPGGLTSTGLVR
jgi:hypothetical protein